MAVLQERTFEKEAAYPASSPASSPEGRKKRGNAAKTPSGPRISAVGKSDKPASQDFLDRKIYVTAVAALIVNPKTQAPLTIGIYGPWGSGKSSFLAQIIACLPKRFMVATFNPWRLSGSGEVWAGLVGEIAPIIDRNLGILQRIRFFWSSDTNRSVSKFRTRLTAASKKASNWLVPAATGGGFLTTEFWDGKELPAFVVASGTWLQGKFAATSMLLTGLEPSSIPWKEVVSYTSAAILILFVLLKIARTLLRPFSTQFAANLAQFKENSQDLKNATFKDFESLRKIVGDFTTKRAKQNKPPLVLMIDDLDRCSPDRVVAVLESVNQFIAELPIITVFAIDTKFVCNAVAAHHRFLFTPPNDVADARELYGRLFLEKIIHIPFQLPAVRSYERYIEELLTISADDNAATIGDAAAASALMPEWSEVAAAHTGAKKTLAFVLYYYLKPFIRGLLPDNTADARWRLAIVARCMFGLPVTEAQRAWLSTQEFTTQIEIGFIETEMRGKLYSTSGLRRAIKRAAPEALATAIKIEENDRAILRGHTVNLKGNPRSIKRFVNTYLLAKGINALATMEQSDPISLDHLAAWLVFLQNWPRVASSLCARARDQNSTSLFTDGWEKGIWPDSAKEAPPPELLAFVNSNKTRLDNLAASPRGLDIARCFSFFTVEA